MGTGRSIQLARVFGIRVGATMSWFFVLFLMIWNLSGYFGDVLNGSDGQAYGVAVAAALLFAVSIVLHELGHALTARRYGIETSGVDLWFFGGVAKLDREPDTPGREFAVAAAGPLVTLIVAVGCIGGAVLASDGTTAEHVVKFEQVSTSPAVALLGWLGALNIFLFAFNIIPAYPLDGGRIAKAIAWKVTDDANRGLRIAARVGQWFSYALIGFGVYLLMQDDGFSGVWLIVLGWFMAQGAKGAVVASAFQEQIDGVTVGDLMDTQPFWMPASTTVLQASEEYFGRHGWAWFAVADEHDGTYKGILSAERTDGALASGQPALLVSELLDPGAETEFSIPERTPLAALLAHEPLRALGALMVVDDGGHLRGVVTIEQIRRALTAAAG